MIDSIMAERPDLSKSAVAEWRLWTFVTASVIHAFEVILDMFRSEMDDLTNQITPGTERWYAEMCRRFQDGHELLFDEKTAMLYYAKDDSEARIVKVVAVTVGDNRLSLKVAKFDSGGKIIPLAEDELYNFTGYVQAFKFADDAIDIVSTTADLIRYDLEVFYSPAVPVTTVQKKVAKALAGFRLNLDFDAMLYPQRLIDAVLAVDGVVTANLKGIYRKGATDPDYTPVEVMAELQSGYFEYNEESTLVLTSIKAKQ